MKNKGLTLNGCVSRPTLRHRLITAREIKSKDHDPKNYAVLPTIPTLAAHSNGTN